MSLSVSSVVSFIFRCTTDNYRYLYFLILIPNALVIVTWTWRHNLSGLSWWSNQVTATIVVFVYVTIFCHFGWNRIHPTLDGLVLGAVVLHIIISFPPDAMCKALDDLWVDCIDSDCWLPSYSWVVLRDGLLVLCSFIGVIALRYSLTHPVQLCDPAPYVLIDEPPLSNLSSQRTRVRRRCGTRTRPKTRCTLVRFVVFGRIHNRRRRYDSPNFT
ncbi:unnamed protein product [Adineta ricciae]|uniref:Uncharacterized protein n=1 Tax=Adineta ricciae TaxID=249248 RepID=A0A814WVY9_ADIRI|nr:unnamed protein product [Adineta ricciae]